MKRFEYKVFMTDAKGVWGGKVDVEEYERMLNALGNEGWEMIESTASNQSYGSTRYILTVFKRETSL